MTCVVYHRPKTAVIIVNISFAIAQISAVFHIFSFFFCWPISKPTDGNVGSFFDRRHDTNLDTLIDRFARGWQSFQPSNGNHFSVLPHYSKKWLFSRESIFVKWIGHRKRGWLQVGRGKNWWKLWRRTNKFNRQHVGCRPYVVNCEAPFRALTDFMYTIIREKDMTFRTIFSVHLTFCGWCAEK